MTLSERARKELLVLALAALMLATASVDATPTLTSTAPWWEKITYTFAGDGSQYCRYETSLSATGAEACESDEAPAKGATSSDGTFTKITIERRFSPEGASAPASLQAGETLLGGQVMAISIDSTGAVKSCKVVGVSGDFKPPFGCNEARAERYRASAPSDVATLRNALMTVLVYGHEEYLS